jgi:uncharacterized protein YbbC (DUF1343 family)
MVLVEGTHLSEGRGTTRPFEFVGAPYIEARRYSDRLNAVKLPGVHFRPAYFQPTFQKWAGVMCGGAQLHVFDRDAFEPYLAGIAVIATARALYPDSFAWREPPYEYEYEKLPIEILCGGTSIPQLIGGGASPDEIRRSWAADVRSFRQSRAPYLLYE